MVAREMCYALESFCLPGYLMVCGSLRRRRMEASDVEVLFCPKTEMRPDGLFEHKPHDFAAEAIERLLISNAIEKRPSEKGSFTWGPLNKLAIHRQSKIPVDLFAEPDPRCWFRSVVIRTGSAETNIKLTTGAMKLNRKLHAYGDKCLEDLATGQVTYPKSEEVVFEFCGVPFRPPWER